MLPAKDIRNKIKSIKNTRKITRAMEMVAASKMRKAQNLMLQARPYALKILNVVHHAAKAHPEYHHDFLQHRPLKRAGVIVITSDRGLCGGLNMNLLRGAIHHLQALKHKNNAEADLCLIGSKAENFFKRCGGNILAQASHLGDHPSISRLWGLMGVMLEHYAQHKHQALFLMYNQFVNTMVQKPVVLKLLPIHINDTDNNPPFNNPHRHEVADNKGDSGHHDRMNDKEKKTRWDYLYEPEAKTVMDTVLKRYIEAQIYRGVLENLACEQAARMIAMKNASDNAGDFIHDLELAYNKARQAAITQELAEIAAGAEAV